MNDAARRHFPAIALDGLAAAQFMHLRVRPLAGRHAAAPFESVDAELVFCSCLDIRAENAVLADQKFGHALDEGRSVDLELGQLIAALVPARHEKARSEEHTSELQSLMR